MKNTNHKWVSVGQEPKQIDVLFSGVSKLVLGTVTPTDFKKFKVLRKKGLAWLEPLLYTNTREEGRKIIEQYHGIQQ